MPNDVILLYKARVEAGCTVRREDDQFQKFNKGRAEALTHRVSMFVRVPALFVVRADRTVFLRTISIDRFTSFPRSLVWWSQHAAAASRVGYEIKASGTRGALVIKSSNDDQG
jgi:hypothetical protein